MNFHLRIISTTILLSSSALTFASTNPVTIPTVVPFAAGLTVNDAVRDECQLGDKVSKYLLAYGKSGVVVGEQLGEGKYLDLAITEVHAPGGGAWSGPKWLEVKGTLKQDATDVASFRAKRFSTGGAFGGFKGTCAILGRTTKALGKDIASWLKDPVDGAALGDAKE